MMFAAVAVAGCSSSNLGTEPSRGVPFGSEPTALAWAGAETCRAGEVLVEVAMPAGESNPTLFYPGLAVVRMSIAGETRTVAGGNRFRVNGAEVGLGLDPNSLEIEVYAGLGEACDWISARRIR